MPHGTTPRPRRTVNVVTSYLAMTRPRHRDSDHYRTDERVRDADQARERARYIDNEGLSLDEGNDFA
jgi:hypothetical protein